MRFSRMLVLSLGVAALLALPAAAGAAKPERQLYVSLGDSYATGYQPSGGGSGASTRNGFAYQVPRLARPRGYRFKLVNFGCPGESAKGILSRKGGCTGVPDGRDPGKRTQAAAAARFLRAHRGEVGLVTVSIGGNDVTRCGAGPDPVACVGDAVAEIEANVRTLVKRLRKAAGKRVRIVGTTYPDVILGRWIGADADQNLARLSVIAFKELINPALKQAYASAGGKFVDVTAASGAYGSLDELVPLATGELVPKPVAQVCELTYYCELRDIHARTSGYELIARLIAESLPRRRSR